MLSTFLFEKIQMINKKNALKKLTVRNRLLNKENKYTVNIPSFFSFKIKLN